MTKTTVSVLILLFLFLLFGCDSKSDSNKSVQSENISYAEKKESENNGKQSDDYDGYMLVSDLDKVDYASAEILVRYGGILYGRSNGIIDVASTIEKVGVIDKVIDKKYVPKYDGETNCEELRNAGVYGEPGDSIILFYNNEYILFERIGSSSIDFKAQYVRTYGYSENEKYPQTMWIKNKDELEKYKNQNKDRCTSEFSDAVKKYDAGFFKNNNLIFVILKESSGSITHEVTDVTLYYTGLDKIQPYSIRPEIKRIVPDVVTCDMAEWHIIIEVSKEYGKNSAKLQKGICGIL